MTDAPTGGRWAGRGSELQCRDCGWVRELKHNGWDRVETVKALGGHRALIHGDLHRSAEPDTPIADRIVQAARAEADVYVMPVDRDRVARAAVVAVLDGLLHSDLWQTQYTVGGGLRVWVNRREVENLRDDIMRGDP